MHLYEFSKSRVVCIYASLELGYDFNICEVSMLNEIELSYLTLTWAFFNLSLIWLYTSLNFALISTFSRSMIWNKAIWFTWSQRIISRIKSIHIYFSSMALYMPPTSTWCHFKQFWGQGSDIWNAIQLYVWPPFLNSGCLFWIFQIPYREN